jgi:hypothetical protein
MRSRAKLMPFGGLRRWSAAALRAGADRQDERVLNEQASAL